MVVISICLVVLFLSAQINAVPTLNLAEEIAVLKERQDQQTLVFDALQSRVGVLEKRLSLSQDLTTEILESVDAHLITLSRNVAFFARLDKSYDDIPAWNTIVFKTVVANKGNSYNPMTGEFSAPVNGTYVFYSNILAKTGLSLETSLQVNNVDVSFLYSGGTTTFFGSGSNMAVLDLKSWDTVKMVKHGPFGKGPFYVHSDWSTFSGFLLKPNFG
ncbi:heavy metal-binding protein HIP-like [Mya arenaria]|uniref:heavy metal-binding protein HIP-like n=1 Tax=Mya arenaria TaxID=6604 RepID=UPI0022E30554|nr:heavy metal-binding protein HIP-like [Mya arenaria]